MSTTGGLDTRMILANVRIDRGALHCYTFCGPVRENLDVTIGRRVAHAAGFEHTTLTIDKRFFYQFDALAKHVILSTDGNLELSGVPEAFVNGLSREISPIRLTGNYGSEVLRRYRSFMPSDSICGVLNDDLAVAVKNAERTWAAIIQDHPLTYIVFKQIPLFSYNRLQFEQADLIMRSPFMDNALLEVIYQAPAECTESNFISLRLIHDGNPLLGGILTDRGVSYPRRPSWPLARAYYELIFKLEYYASHGMPTRLAAVDRRLGALSLERNFLGRNKYYHLRQWFRDELASYVRDILLDDRTLARDYLDRKMVIQAVSKHLAGIENTTHIIDKLIAIELTNRLVLEATNP
jgi:asparagine synthase (glutamine-hydrolysing)